MRLRPPRPAPASLLRHRDFRLVFTANLVSGFGSQVSLVALPLTAILAFDASPFQVGLLAACGTVAVLLVGLPAGPWVHRMRRRRVMIVGDLGRAAALASIPLAWWAGALTMVQLYAVALVHGVLSVFFDVAAQSYLPYVIGRDRLVEGNARLGLVDSLARTAGPSLGGVVISLLTAPVAIVLDTVSYLCSAAAAAAVATREPAPPGSAEKKRLRAEIAEGLRWLWRHPMLRPAVLSSASSNFFGTVSWVMLIAMVGQVLRLPAWMIGLVYSAGGVGGLIGALAAGRVIARVGLGRALWLVLALTTPCQLLVPLVGRGWLFWPALVSQLGIWASIGIRNVAQLSFRQQATPDALLTRINATARFLVWGTLPLGGLAAGLLGEYLGVRTTLWIAAAGLSLTWLPPFLSPLRTLRALPPTPAQEAVAVP
ncbi:MFS transporter [Kitasatospora cineracea]|uniref:MFS transporter n=1 Tax=Kitasatospora cineracea TaxID=88074 RepID=UPI00341208F3